MLNSTTNTFQPLNDSSLFSPSVNPEITDSSGAYGWLVVPGEYFVQVTAQGYYSANSSIVTVPPAITDLNVALGPVPSTNSSSAPPPPLVLGNITWYTPAYQGLEYFFPASVAINGRQFSATFYESLIAQFQLVPGEPYAGYYAGTFGAISGCQEGSNITLTATVNGTTESGWTLCPAAGKTTTINMNFSSSSSASGVQSVGSSDRVSVQWLGAGALPFMMTSFSIRTFNIRPRLVDKVRPTLPSKPVDFHPVTNF